MANLTLSGNPRVQPKALQPIFGYDQLFMGVAEIEIASLEELADIGIIPADDARELTEEVRRTWLEIKTTEVDKIEREITKHDVRAWVRLAQERSSPKLARWIHILLTSYDPLDSGRIIHFIRAYDEVLAPSLARIVSILADRTCKFASLPQIGRTHGQHALPITVGFWLATILNRILFNWNKLHEARYQLVGKISGAVGAYNAQVGLGITKLYQPGESFEANVLARVGLKAAPISTQILAPDPLAYFLFSVTMLSSVFGQLGRDCRQLMRTEIGEVAEEFEEGQVGSSTMAQKRNPITFENIEGTWIKNKNEFGKVLDTLISEHQRDLVGSTVARDFPTILVNLQEQMNKLLSKPKKKEGQITEPKPFLARIVISEKACQRNLSLQRNVILAEPLYIALQMAGFNGDAHDFVNHQLVPRATTENKLLIEVLQELAQQDDLLSGVVSAIPEDVINLLHHPEKYTGLACEQALKIAQAGRDQVEAFGFQLEVFD